MKRSMLRFLLCLFVFIDIFPLQYLGTAYGAQGDPEFLSTETILIDLIYQRRLEWGSNPKPFDVDSIVPGDSFERIIQINPNCKSSVDVQLDYVKSKVGNTFIKYLKLKIADEKGKVLFNGNCDMDTPISLGKVEKNTVKLILEFYFPKEASNEFQNARGEIHYGLTARADEETTTQTDDGKNTGDGDHDGLEDGDSSGGKTPGGKTPDGGKGPGGNPSNGGKGPGFTPDSSIPEGTGTPDETAIPDGPTVLETDPAGGGKTTGSGSVPKTGDNSHIVESVVLFTGSVLGILFLCIIIKKKSKRDT